MNVVLPAGVVSLINEGLEQINVHSEHYLLPIQRLKIYDAIDTHMGSRSHLIKTWCGILSTRRVLTLLNANLKEEDYDLSSWWESYPVEMLLTTETLIRHQETRKSAEELLAQFQEMSDLTGESMDSPYFVRWCIFEAGLSTLREAIYPQAWQQISIDNKTTDFDLRHHGDAAKYAAIAYAGGAWQPTDLNRWSLDEKKQLWIPKDDDAYYYYDIALERGKWDYDDPTVRLRRKEFWEWWLTDVISSAWHQTL
jgi:hypothetical protein